MAEQDAINNVRRKINEVMKKTDERIVVGWRPGLDDYKEGDVWEDHDGRQWTIKNGIRQRVTKLDAAKTPWWCPECQKTMSHRLDTKYWNLHGKCMDCVIKYETELRRTGKWKEYEEKKVKANYLASLKDRIAFLEDLRDTASAPEIVHADDTRILMIEKWDVNIDKVKEDIQKDIDELNGYLAEFLKENANETT
jgi:hypothetical protein